jgi:hypothetical protein
MICVHSATLATIIAGLVGVFVVHVIGDPNFREYHWMIAHVTSTFLAKEFELVTQTIANSGLANLDRKGRGEVLAPENANDIYIVESVPAAVSTTDK